MDNKDLSLLVEKINKATDGDWSMADENQFDDPEVAMAINRLMKSVVARENHFAVRINDAMTKIADNSCVKTMLDEIESQRENINTLQNASRYFHSIIEEKENFVTKIYAMAKEIKANLDDEAAQCDEIVDKINSLLSKYSFDARTENALKDLRSDLNILQSGKLGTSMRIRDVAKEISEMYNRNNAQSKGNDLMLDSLAMLLESYVRMNINCLNTGAHLHLISRDIDNARNTMYRSSTFNLIHDKLKVFEVDHLTLAWRLYNHNMEYENLKITQINNPDGCKFGLWAKNEMEKDTELSHSDEFKKVVQAHYEFHDYAVSCYLLKEGFKHKEAKQAFKQTLEANKRLSEAIDDLHDYLNRQGIVDETEVWKYDEKAPIRLDTK